jgi:uncharacterized protein (TIGR00730 family)
MPEHDESSLPRFAQTFDEELLLGVGTDVKPEAIADPARIARIDAEFKMGFDALKNVDRAVSIFGSARTKPDDPDYKRARVIARHLGLAGYSIITGGGPGMMEAANRGARDAGAVSIGCNIELPHEQKHNDYLDISIDFRHFFARKVMFVRYSQAFVVMPGGFGTLDEMFEILTLVQTDKLSKKIGVVLYGREYWEKVLDLKPMAEWGAIAEKDLELLHYADTPADAFQHLRDHLIAHHLEPATEQEAATPGIAKTRG